MVTNDHHNPSSDPEMKDLGKSTWFQFISCKRKRTAKCQRDMAVYAVAKAN